jgi:hypothetical protein
MLNISDTVGTIYTGGTFTALARIVDWSNNLLTVENTASVSLTITGPDGNPVANFSGLAITPSTVLFDTLQTSPAGLWTADAIGYNFAHTIDVSVHPAFAVEGLYSVQYTIQPTLGQVIIIRWAITAD